MPRQAGGSVCRHVAASIECLRERQKGRLVSSQGDPLCTSNARPAATSTSIRCGPAGGGTVSQIPALMALDLWRARWSLADRAVAVIVVDSLTNAFDC